MMAKKTQSEHVGLPIGQSSLPVLVMPCSQCEGSGNVFSESWEAFERKYPNAEDWKAAVLRGERPDQLKKSDCPHCRGSGKVLTENGERVAEVVRLVK